MIKLNNKNITYVALADSANSLKAPKEIWYADSNNSVKLVYQRKDALIEGEDYEKYHWLRAEMPLNKLLMTLSVNSNNVDFYIKRLSLGNITILITNGYKYFFWNNAYEIGSFGNGADVEHHKYSSDTQLFHIVTNSTNVLINGIQFNSVGFPIRSINFITEPAGNEGVTLTSTISVDEIERYIPCKLLKPVPKWLDANGIRRQVGECGMVDLVSGKFYGNVNSTGTFTVENYYERKEWLRAEINVSGQMALLPVNSMNLYFKSKRIIGSNFHYFSTNDYEYYCEPTNVGRRLSIWKFSENTVVYRNTDIDIDSNKVIIDCSPNKIYVNGYEVPIYGYPISHVDIRAMSNTGMETLTSSIFVDGTERYIPCTLTMDLPASMDANNIARTKGTSGMWDLVSDRFYGNVANSGTFKAVNLAEGVDYEVHQWLVGDGAALFYESINFQSAKWELSNVTKYAALNDFQFNAETYAAFQIVAYPYNRTGIGIFDNTEGRGYLYTDVENVNVIEIQSQTTSSSIVINETDFSNPTLTIKPYFNLSKVAFGDVKCSSITVDGIERYIPVKLLKSIPSRYDANGIARQVGECGMYDTVNDVFYGNVASSGSFTVEDDN